MGAKRLLAGDTATAKDWFEKCVAMGQKILAEHQSAVAELRLLKDGK